MNLKNIQFHILTITGLIMFIGALVYRFYNLGNIGIFLTLLLSAGIYIIILLKVPRGNQKNRGARVKYKTDFFNGVLQLLYLLVAAAIFLIVYLNKTTGAIVSPWEILPFFFWVFMFLAGILLVLLIMRRAKLVLLNIILFYLLVFSIAVIIFPLGFGFDPFVHQATMEHIIEHGAVEPKPWYYLGQYAWLVVLHKITFLPLMLLHHWLVPLMAAVFIPLALKSSLGNWLQNGRGLNLLVLFALLIPFSIFTLTTPQNLAFLLLLLAVIYSLDCRSWRDLALLYILSSAALLTQPIAGLPALLFTGLLTVYHSEWPRKNVLYLIPVALLVIALPAAFVLVGPGPAGAGASPAPLREMFAPRLPGTENITLNSLYLYGFNLPWLFIALITAGLAVAWQNKKYCKYLPLYIMSGGAMLASYFILRTFDFSYLIDYEQQNFANRLLIVSLIFFQPFAWLALYGFLHKLKQKSYITRIIFLGFGLLMVLAALYFSYPRFDRYHNSHSYTVSQSDIKAVNRIEQDAAGEDYIVLANQQVSAAALREFGFKRYFSPDNKLVNRQSQIEIFYYPIPTGGPLYRHYLDMVYAEPSRAEALEAMDLAGVDTAYFVLNRYWWAFDKIAAEARLAADDIIGIGNKGEVLVFKYVRAR